jgi:pimeloyl-ACP methyl ester carboxylesterase/DNA-binding CsgD family transcriptional regulator
VTRETLPAHTIRFGRSSDGVRIAYAEYGEGPPLILNTCWVSQLEYDLQSPVWRHFLEGLARLSTVYRYDERGFGLSDWDVPDFAFESRIRDLEAVADASGLERFALLGMAQGGPVAIAYAHRHPERVSRLVLLGTYACIPSTGEDAELDDALTRLIEVGWGRPEGRFRRVFTDMFMPGATDEQMLWMDELMRRTTSPGNAAAYRRARVGIDVTDLLPELDLPTLVMHGRGDQVNPFDEGRAVAAAIPGARLVTLETNNHVLLESDPASAAFFAELEQFLAPDRELLPSPSQGQSQQASEMLARLTPRERDVLALVAVGRDNSVIAQQLSLSVRTVERHLQTIYRKLDLFGSSQRTAAAALLLGGDAYASTATIGG